VESGGVAVYVQGMQRFYSLEICRGGGLRLVKALDGLKTLAEAPFDFELWQEIAFSLQAETTTNEDGAPVVRLRAWVDGTELFDIVDQDRPLLEGSIGLVIDEGHILADGVNVQAV
jgi:hypothetical protein